MGWAGKWRKKGRAFFLLGWGVSWETTKGGEFLGKDNCEKKLKLKGC